MSNNENRRAQLLAGNFNMRCLFVAVHLDFRPAPLLIFFPGVVPQNRTFATGIQVVMFSGQLTCSTCFVALLTA